MRRVPLVEHEVDDVEHRVETAFEIRTTRELEGETPVANLPLRAHEPLRDRRFLREKGPRDLPYAEAADGFEAERHARVARNLRVAAHHNHPQLVVAELFVEIG